MRLLIAAMGSRGDVQPALALGLALQAKGHEVTLSAPPDFAAWASQLDLPFVPAGESVEEALKANAGDIRGNPLRILRAMKRIFPHQISQWFERTLDGAQNADAIVSCGQFASRSVAEKLGISCFCVIYQPTVLRSDFHPPLLVPWQNLPRSLNRILWFLSDKAVGNLALGPINSERKKLGLQPHFSFARYMFDGMPIFLAADPLLALQPPDWNSHHVIATGPWFYEDPAPLPADVEDFLNAGTPPVYVGFGSMPARDPAGMTRAVISGASANGRRVLLSKGWAGIGDGDLPFNVKVVHDPMPHHRLFPRLLAVVHHGGSGTTATALRCGVPQVLVPHLLDQFYYAHRMEKLGLAPPGIPADKLTAKSLARAIDAALSLPSASREEAGARLRNLNGVDRAIAEIESRVRCVKNEIGGHI